MKYLPLFLSVLLACSNSLANTPTKQKKPSNLTLLDLASTTSLLEAGVKRMGEHNFVGALKYLEEAEKRKDLNEVGHVVLYWSLALSIL